MKYRVYPVCAKCSIVMDPGLYDDVSPGYVTDNGIYCPDCFKEWAKEAIDDDPETIAAAMGIEIRRYE